MQRELSSSFAHLTTIASSSGDSSHFGLSLFALVHLRSIDSEELSNWVLQASLHFLWMSSDDSFLKVNVLACPCPYLRMLTTSRMGFSMEMDHE